MVKLIVKEWEVVVVVVVIISRLKLKQSEIVVKTTFTFDELQPNKTVGWNFHVATLKGYDMIIGRDMMSALGIDVLFSQERITWEGFDFPLRNIELRISKRTSLSLIQKQLLPRKTVWVFKHLTIRPRS